MINYIIINGTNSNTINGLGINELPPISKPPLRVQTEEIDGRDGDISTNLGYGAYDKTISIGLFGTGYDINEVISFFNGEGTVVFSNETNKYYKYKIINQIDYEALLKFKSATITFHCQPFKYPLEETPLEIEYEYIEQEGVESATMNNTEENKHLDIKLNGNIGKNLFDYKQIVKGSLNASGEIVRADNYVTINSLENNTITITTTAGYRGFTSPYIKIKPNTDYTFSIGSTTLSGEIVVFCYYDENKNFISSQTQYNFNNKVINQNASYVRFSYEGNVVNNGTISNIMLEQSSSATSYEPYLPYVSGDNTIKVEGKNRFNGNLVSTTTPTNYTITFENEILTIKHNNSYSTGTPEINMGTLQQGTYVLNGTLPEGSGIGLYRNGTYSTMLYNNSIFSISGTENITLKFPNGEATTKVYSNVMVRLSTTDDTYQPYQSQTYPIYLGVENIVDTSQQTFSFNASSTYYQYLTKLITAPNTYQPIHLEAGTTYYISYNIDNDTTGNTRSTPRLYLDSSNYYQQTSTNRNLTKGRKVETYTPTTTGNYDCQYWLQGSNEAVSISDFMISTTKSDGYTPYGTTPIQLNLGDKIDGTTNSWKVVRTDTTEEDITDTTLIGQLNDIYEDAKAYDTQTNVSQTNNLAPFLLDLKTMKKGTDEVVINNIGNVYAKPTIALEGTGETDIYLNNTEILKVDLSEKNKITIDTNNMEAYDPTDNSLANRKVIGNYNSMTLPSGNTTMKITGALTKATITDYSRWL